MLKARHDELLEHTFFSGSVASGSSDELQVVEMWKYAGAKKVKEGKNFRHASLPDHEVELWLAGEEKWKPLAPSAGAVLEGGIRLLFCERVNFRPPGFGMSREAYLAVEREFELPQGTLDAAFDYGGKFFKKFQYSTDNTLEKISFLLKAPQKMPIANYLLALSHNISTGMTTALIHEAPIVYTTQRRHRDYHRFNIHVHDKKITQSSQIISRLQSSISQWANPMLLPIILMENHMIRSRLFAHDLDDQVVALERQTGVVFAGRSVRPKELAIQPEQIPKVSIRKLTQDMHTLLTEIIFYERVLEWSFDCADSLQKCTRELSKSTLPESRTGLYESNRDILETIEYLAASRKSMSNFQRTSKERVQSQIGVLYSFTAQIDNSINAKIAVSSARDSSAMKTLALITTIFLPGTYIATLFSMSMFDWSSSSSSAADNTDTVSKKFWIYWAVTIPLTLLVMILWRLWWLWQERLYQREVSEAVEKVMDDEA
ncbi:hypothetical protein LCER1_G005876 [Lachnellula cervina]|uniref:Uncharacterized protein n=1 Tax=Lachnellula cervina TaxID=1316786 RepID=A0A7D8YPF1_9HELO|nr:hypothetical protein LCER1_G005876 [Lachnellula cervina]